MPQAVAERVHAAPVFPAHDLAVFVEVRDVGQRGVAGACGGVDHAQTDRRHQLSAEPAREGGLLVVGDLLVANHQHAVTVHQRAHAVERGVVEHAQVGAVQLAHEERMELPCLQFGGGHDGFDAAASS